FFFFQAEDGIRDFHVTGVQTCALPIFSDRELYGLCRDIVAICDAYGATCIVNDRVDVALAVGAHGTHLGADDLPVAAARAIAGRSEERRVGKECSCGWATAQ